MWSRREGPRGAVGEYGPAPAYRSRRVVTASSGRPPIGQTIETLILKIEEK